MTGVVGPHGPPAQCNECSKPVKHGVGKTLTLVFPRQAVNGYMLDQVIAEINR